MILLQTHKEGRKSHDSGEEGKRTPKDGDGKINTTYGVQQDESTIHSPTHAMLSGWLINNQQQKVERINKQQKQKPKCSYAFLGGGKTERKAEQASLRFMREAA